MAGRTYEEAKALYEAGQRNVSFDAGPVYGPRTYDATLIPDSYDYKVFNPAAQVNYGANLTQAQQIFKQATGLDLTGDGLNVVTGHIRQGDSPEQALKNLGDLGNYVKFSTDYNGGTSGGPAGPAGPDYSKTPGFWEASAGVTTPQATLQAVPNPLQGYQGGNATTSSIVDYLGSLGKPSDFASRKTLAEQAGIQNYTGTAAQNTQLLGMLRGSTPASSVITPSSLESAKGITLPGVQGVTNQSDAMVASSVTTLAELIKQLTPPETTADKQEQILLDQMASLTGDLGNKGADQLASEQAAGLPQLKQALADINAQILAKEAEYRVLQTANENKPITMNSIIGNERAILNAKAADMGLLQAQALGLQGKISAAQDTVNRAIDLKYSTIEAKLNLYQAQLQALQPTLDKEERIRAQAQQIMIDNQRQALADARQEEKDIQSLMLEAIKSGIRDSSVLSKIGSSKSFAEAAKLLGQNLPESSGELLSPTDAAALGVPYGTTKEQAANMGISPRDVKGTLTPQEIINLEMKLNKDVFTSTKEAREAERNVSIMNTALQTAKQQIASGGDIGSSSQAIITAFNKILDPTSVVRESEYARTPEGVSLINKIQGYYTKLASGGAGLTVDSLQEYVNTANQFLQNYTDSQISVLDRARTQAENYGLNLNNILDPQAQTILNQYDNKQLQNYYGSLPANEKIKIDALFRDNPNLSSHDILSIVNGSFNEVGGDTKTATKVAAISDGTKGGQCGRFVNQLTGLGVGDSYQSKIAKMNPAIKYPQPGMVFTMPSNGAYSEYGHVGIILSVKDGIATVKDSNWRGDEKVLTHQIPISKMTGFAYA